MKLGRWVGPATALKFKVTGQGHFKVKVTTGCHCLRFHVATVSILVCLIFTKFDMVLVYIIAIHLHDLKVKVIPGSR